MQETTKDSKQRRREDSCEDNERGRTLLHPLLFFSDSNAAPLEVEEGAHLCPLPLSAAVSVSCRANAARSVGNTPGQCKQPHRRLGPPPPPPSPLPLAGWLRKEGRKEALIAQEVFLGGGEERSGGWQRCCLTALTLAAHHTIETRQVL